MILASSRCKINKHTTSTLKIVDNYIPLSLSSRYSGAVEFFLSHDHLGDEDSRPAGEAGVTNTAEPVLAQVQRGNIINGRDAELGTSPLSLGGRVIFVPQSDTWLPPALTVQDLLHVCIFLVKNEQTAKNELRSERDGDGGGQTRQEKYSSTKKNVEELALELFDVLKMTPAFRQRRIGLLSGGEKRRVAICAVMLRRPQLLVLDEPISGLDDRTGDEVLLLLRSLARKYGICVVLRDGKGLVISAIGGLSVLAEL